MEMGAALLVLLCPIAFAANPNSFSSGILSSGSPPGTGMPGGAKCVSTSGPLALSSDTTLCDGGGGGGAGFVAYDGAGKWGSYAATSDPGSVRLGAGGTDRLHIGSSLLRASVPLDMGGNKALSLAAGTVSSTSTNAINGSQLHDLTSKVAATLGGGAAVDSNGKLTAPNYTVGRKQHNNVGSALGNLDGRVTGNTTAITDLTTGIVEGTIGLVQQDPQTRAISVAKATDGNTVSLDGRSGARRVTGVERGVAVNDAVNVGQLNDVWDQLSQQIDHNEAQANRGIAAAAALVNVTPYVPGKTALNAGVASYRNETALGIGLSRWSEDGTLNLNGGISAVKGDSPIVRMGVGIVF